MSRFLTQLDPDSIQFPSPRHALTEPNGLLAIGGDLSPQRLLLAYHNGIFPWYGAHHPILWWSPNPRGVLPPEHVHVSRSMQKLRRNHPYEIWINRNFMATVRACAAPRRDCDDTWINEELMASYAQLHDSGYAHSVEVWQNDALIGGLYGISIGRVFCGESMFSRVVNTSKLALVEFCNHFNSHGGRLIDCQMQTEHLASLGVIDWPREQFLQSLYQLRDQHLDSSCWHRQQIGL